MSTRGQQNASVFVALALVLAAAFLVALLVAPMGR